MRFRDLGGGLDFQPIPARQFKLATYSDCKRSGMHLDYSVKRALEYGSPGRQRRRQHFLVARVRLRTPRRSANLRIVIGLAYGTGQGAVILLAAGSHRGETIFPSRMRLHSQSRIMRYASIVLLIFSLLLITVHQPFPIIATITWIGLFSLEAGIATLLCTLLGRGAKRAKMEN